MIRLSKKGFPAAKLIGSAKLGIRDVESMGECISIRLDDYELLLSPERAASLASRLFGKVRLLEKKDRDLNQENLPLETEGVSL